MCRVDATGLYHGHARGVDKYSYTGKLLWTNKDVKDIMFGVQTRHRIDDDEEREKNIGKTLTLQRHEQHSRVGNGGT